MQIQAIKCIGKVLFTCNFFTSSKKKMCPKNNLNHVNLKWTNFHHKRKGRWNCSTNSQIVLLLTSIYNKKNIGMDVNFFALLKKIWSCCSILWTVAQGLVFGLWSSSIFFPFGLALSIYPAYYQHLNYDKSNLIHHSLTSHGIILLIWSNANFLK